MWWIRGWDFPRIQIATLSIITLCLSVFVHHDLWYQWLINTLLACSLIWQLYKIVPFTFLYKKQVISTKTTDPDRQISIIVANVLMTNTQTKLLSDLVKEMKPDLLLTLETDTKWQQALQPLEEMMPHVVQCPQDNLYGMHLYSRLELVDPKINFVIEDGVPSIHTGVILPSGEKITLHCLHPAPPSPTENRLSSERDAELITVGREIKKHQAATIATGDLNDVAWSDTTLLFRKISGLLDPRIGRGMFNSFHADHYCLRWPLDHLFHSNDFTATKLQRLCNIGSDHFPLYCQLQYAPRATSQQEAPTADSDDKEWAKQKVTNGKKNPSDPNA